MKKIILSVLAIAAMATTANAQLWFGGSVGFRHNKNVIKTENQDTKVPPTNNFYFSPMVGYDLDEKLSVGGELDFQHSSSGSVRNVNTEEVEVKSTTTRFGVTPFARYKFAEFNKFGLVAVARLPFTYTTGETSMGSQTTKNNPTTSIGLGLNPILTYSLNDHFQLECGLNFLSLGASHSVSKDRDNSKNKSISNNFSFGANTNNVVNVGNITIGFIYRL